jgi:glycine/D-amino acid oxidase-like deaminating enzyme
MELRIPAERIEVSEEVDLLVVGGGSAGTLAAVSAARLGLRSALVEQMPFLGGMSTGGCVGTFCGFYTQQRSGEVAPLVGGLPLEIARTLLERNHAIGPIPYETTAVLPYVPWGVKLLLEELVRAEPGLHVRLHAKLTHALVEGGDIQGVVVQAGARRIALRARVYVDASGDAELARLAGAETLTGELPQYPSMMFTMQNVDVGQAIASLPGLPELLRQRFEVDGLPRKSGNLIPTGRPGEVIVALSRLEFEGRPVDAAAEEELSWAELEGRAQAARLAEFLKQHVPGFSEAFLADSAPRLGIRETRKIAGEYTLREDDVLGGRKFEDGIGRCAWPIERHVPGGETSWQFLEAGAWYTLPYRCLLPKRPRNLLVAGRCLSAESAAFASARVIGPCMLAGQAVAAAARLMHERHTSAADVDVDALRAQLSVLGVPL